MKENFMFKELLEQKQEAYRQYQVGYESIQPLWKDYIKKSEQIYKEFIKQKLYISIDKLEEYLKDKEAENLSIVFEDGSWDRINHPDGIYYENEKWAGKDGYIPGRLICTNSRDDGYYFTYDIDEQGIIGFFDLQYIGGEMAIETYMEEIIKDK